MNKDEEQFERAVEELIQSENLKEGIKSLIKNARRSTLEEVENEMVRLWNRRGEKLQNPDKTDCKDFSHESWYKAKQIDKHDNLFWRDWLILVEKLKQRG